MYWDPNFEKITGLRVDLYHSYHLYSKIIYNSLMRATFVGWLSVGDLGGRKGLSAGIPPLLRLLSFCASVLTGLTLVVKGRFKSEAVSGWGKEITLSKCYLFHSALENKVTCFSQPFGV